MGLSTLGQVTEMLPLSWVPQVLQLSCLLLLSENNKNKMFKASNKAKKICKQIKLVSKAYEADYMNNITNHYYIFFFRQCGWHSN